MEPNFIFSRVGINYTLGLYYDERPLTVVGDNIVQKIEGLLSRGDNQYKAVLSDHFNHWDEK